MYACMHQLNHNKCSFILLVVLTEISHKLVGLTAQDNGMNNPTLLVPTTVYSNITEAGRRLLLIILLWQCTNVKCVCVM